MEDDLQKKMEDDLKNKNKKIRRRPQKKEENDLKKRRRKKGRRPEKKIKILIPLKFRGKPFLGLAQLSKIFQ